MYPHLLNQTMGCHGNHTISNNQIGFIFDVNMFLHLSGPIKQIRMC